MTLVSSFRPHADDPVYRENQVRALSSWEPMVDRIVYFGQFEPELSRPNVIFVECEEWPRIGVMAEYCAQVDRVSAIVNSDIVLAPAVSKVFEIVRHTSIGAATSRRYDLETGKLNPMDKGRDIFICKDHVWSKLAKAIPDTFRIGHQSWDGWAVGFFRVILDKRFAEFTQMKAVFHPQHEGRKTPHSAEIEVSGPYYGYWDGTPDTQIV